MFICNRALSRWMLASIALVCAACSTVPITGRQSLSLLPEAQLAAMSVDSYRQVLAEETISNDASDNGLVVRVAQRLADATEEYLRANGYSTDHLDWEFKVIADDETVNAWALPGGKIAVYTGILPIAQSDAGLAVVLGHEIGHAIAGHSNERVSQALLAAAGTQGIGAFMQNRPEQTREIVMAGIGMGVQVGVLLPYGRLQESEADRIGLTLMALAGYDPREAVPFWQRMSEKAGGSRPPEILSTHPDPSTRIADIQRYLPEAMGVYQQNSPGGSTDSTPNTSSWRVKSR